MCFVRMQIVHRPLFDSKQIMLPVRIQVIFIYMYSTARYLHGNGEFDNHFT